MSCNFGCEQLRLADRCVECNPRYGDPDLEYEMYKDYKAGATEAEAERAAIARGRSKNAPSRWDGKKR